jgi:rubrerythrin
MKKTQAKPKTKQATDELTPRIDLLYQALETELGGVEIYTTALECVQNDDLREEWEKYLEQTKEHVEVIRGVCTELGLDPNRETPGRQVVRHIGGALLEAMQMALEAGDSEAAELVAAECVMLAETKDHSNWSLIGEVAEDSEGKEHKLLHAAFEQVEDEEDEHLYHTSGWARELWLAALHLPAELPPPEEEQDVHSQAEAARVKKKSVAKRHSAAPRPVRPSSARK